MKKLFFVLAASACMMLAAQTASAQIYFGGSVAYSSTSTDDGLNTQTSKQSGSSYKLMPEIGYRINKTMAVGGTVGIMHGFAALGALDPNDYKGIMLAAAGSAGDMLEAQTTIGTRTAGNRKVNGIRFAPYFRYTIVNGRRFDLFVDGVVGYSQFKSETLNANNAWVAGPTYSMTEVGARPGFLVKFDSNFSIIAHLGNLGIQNIKGETINPDNSKTTTSISRFGLDVDSNNIFLGFIYTL